MCGTRWSISFAPGLRNRLAHRSFVGLVGVERRQVLRLAAAVWQNQSTQRMGSPRFLVNRRREEGPLGFPGTGSAGKLSTPDLHDDRRRCRCRQSIGRLPCIACDRPVAAVVTRGQQKRQRIRAATDAARALAHRHRAHQHSRKVLLFMHGVGRCQPPYCGLEFVRVDAGPRCPPATACRRCE